MLLTAWVKFIFYASLLSVAGYLSCRYGYSISKKSRISEGFMGVFFLAFATSTPELFTSISAVKSGAFDLALGDIFGSLLSNLFILIMLNLFISKRGLLNSAVKLKGVVVVIALQALIIVSIFLRNIIGLNLDLFNFGLENLFIFLLYTLFLRSELKENREDKKPTGIKNKRTKSCLREWGIFVAALFAIVMFSQLLVIQSKVIVESSILNYLFFGTLFLGFVTSLPELIVTVSALMNRSHSMAIGNIVGSNALDLAILPLLELVSLKVSIFSKISLAHIYTLITVEIVTIALFVLARSKRVNRFYGLIMLLLLIVPLIMLF
jgi:cation:H+ antiporter